MKDIFLLNIFKDVFAEFIPNKIILIINCVPKSNKFMKRTNKHFFQKNSYLYIRVGSQSIGNYVGISNLD